MSMPNFDEILFPELESRGSFPLRCCQGATGLTDQLCFQSFSSELLKCGQNELISYCTKLVDMLFITILKTSVLEFTTKMSS